uniref:Uncharacterized protein n=1 Tax=Quercus lobata TaxID=97700 RepID=A0A7N2KVI4_QUELO
MAIDRIMESSGAVLRTQGFEEGFSLSTMSDEVPESLENGVSEDNFVCKIKNLDDGTEFAVDELGQDGMLSRLREVGSNRSISFQEFHRNFGPSPLVHHHLRREIDEARYLTSDLESALGTGMQRVRVHPYSKRSKELSSLYVCQEFVAHEGPILTMKFSLDGGYLASAGKDGIVRVWKVIEEESSEAFENLEIDPSCVYFTGNHLSKLSVLDVDKGKFGKMEKLRKSSGSVCAILRTKFLLSSFVDKTVCLWQVGCDRCLRVFSHNNYVTCVNFNPVDGNYFISGSIDGKVRISEIVGCKVVDYIDTREIVTAVCYWPDGKGGIVGTMTGNCRFYDIIGKKEVTRQEDNWLSVIRILMGVDVICKFKGLKNAGSQMSASFTLDGKHIVSASDNSNVHIWNYASQDKVSSRAKTIWSSESFLSHNASIAIPWCGMQALTETLLSPTLSADVRGSSVKTGSKHRNFDENSDQKMPLSSPDCFSLNRGFLLESLPKGSATWPEKKLSDSSLFSSICKSEYKFLKNACQSLFSSPHMWGLVVVTAGWDGRIRTSEYKILKNPCHSSLLTSLWS